ncbi:MAG TPA: hypothetical protein VGR57_09140 [Ktedonobacterales bacterium]|nr:hypothetical protein [Ktedonobacterales bacterium]
MPQTIPILFGIAGVILLFVALLGGNFVIFQFNIPRVADWRLRMASGATGVLLVLVSLATAGVVGPPRGSTSTRTSGPTAVSSATFTVISTAIPVVTIAKTTFFLPQDGVANKNGYIGPFCCTGRTATVQTLDGTPIGYIYFFSWSGQAYNTGTGSSAAPDLVISVSGISDLKVPTSKQQQSSVQFLAGEMRPGLTRATRAGGLNFSVTIVQVDIVRLNDMPYYDMSSIAIKVDVSATAG